MVSGGKMEKRDPVTTKIKHFRAGTRFEMRKFALVYNGGGIGDYIHWTTAIRYVLDTYDYIEGYIITPSFFADLAKLWLTPHPRFELRISEEYEKEPYLEDIPCVVPLRNQYANAGGFHLFELGFIYFNQNKNIPIGYREIPRIEGNEADISAFDLPERYAVITVMATADNRRLDSKLINSLISFYNQKGITPVLLGKEVITETYRARAPKGIRGQFIDLRNKTTLLEAAVILSKAHSVIGLDNGLLHLAACSSVPVVFLYTTVEPSYRNPPRRPGAKTIVITPTADLPCRFCQTNMRYLIHDFKSCVYGDNICTEFEPAAIFKVLNESLFKENDGN